MERMKGRNEHGEDEPEKVGWGRGERMRKQRKELRAQNEEGRKLNQGLKKRQELCRWFRFAQLAKGKKPRP